MLLLEHWKTGIQCEAPTWFIHCTMYTQSVCNYKSTFNKVVQPRKVSTKLWLITEWKLNNFLFGKSWNMFSARYKKFNFCVNLLCISFWPYTFRPTPCMVFFYLSLSLDRANAIGKVFIVILLAKQLFRAVTVHQ